MADCRRIAFVSYMNLFSWDKAKKVQMTNSILSWIFTLLRFLKIKVIAMSIPGVTMSEKKTMPSVTPKANCLSFVIVSASRKTIKQKAMPMKNSARQVKNISKRSFFLMCPFGLLSGTCASNSEKSTIL